MGEVAQRGQCLGVVGAQPLPTVPEHPLAKGQGALQISHRGVGVGQVRPGPEPLHVGGTECPGAMLQAASDDPQQPPTLVVSICLTRTHSATTKHDAPAPSGSPPDGASQQGGRCLVRQ